MNRYLFYSPSSTVRDVNNNYGVQEGLLQQQISYIINIFVSWRWTRDIIAEHWWSRSKRGRRNELCCLVSILFNAIIVA